MKGPPNSSRGEESVSGHLPIVAEGKTGDQQGPSSHRRERGEGSPVALGRGEGGGRVPAEVCFISPLKRKSQEPSNQLT